MAWTISLYVLGGLLLAVGFAGLALPVLPGSPLMWLGVLAMAWAEDFRRIGLPGLVACGLLALLMLVVDWVSELVGAKRFGASWWGLGGAALGMVVGVFFGLPGIVIGPVAGALALELLKDRDVHRAARAGMGTVVGFVLGTAVKYALAMVFAGLVGLLLLF